jgi:hypothetical protein
MLCYKALLLLISWALLWSVSYIHHVYVLYIWHWSCWYNDIMFILNKSWIYLIIEFLIMYIQIIKSFASSLLNNNCFLLQSLAETQWHNSTFIILWCCTLWCFPYKTYAAIAIDLWHFILPVWLCFFQGIWTYMKNCTNILVHLYIPFEVLE